MSYPFAELVFEKFRQPAVNFLTAMDIDPTPEGIRTVGRNIVDLIYDKAMNERAKYEKKSSLSKLLFLSLYINTMWAKPAASLIIPPERVEAMRSVGMSDPAIYLSVAIHSGFDHFIPDFLIGGYAIAMNQNDVPAWLLVPGSFLAGRMSWGLMTSAVHEGVFAAINLHNSGRFIPKENEGLL